MVKSLAEEIELIVKDLSNNNPPPRRCKVSGTYPDKKHVDAFIDGFGKVIYKPIFGVADVGDECLIVFLNGDLNNGAVISGKYETGDLTNLYQALADLSKNKADINHNHDERYFTEAEMENKLSAKSDITHKHNSLDINSDISIVADGSKIAGYRKIFTIKIIRSYLDAPISFTLSTRNSKQNCRYHILFKSSNTVDPELASFTYEGVAKTPVYIFKEDNQTWSVLVKEQTNWEIINTTNILIPENSKQRLVFTPKNELLSGLPENVVMASQVCATQDTNGLMSAQDKIKLENINMFYSDEISDFGVKLIRYSNIVFFSLLNASIELDSNNKLTIPLSDEYLPLREDLTFYATGITLNGTSGLGITVSFEDENIILDFNNNEYVDSTLALVVNFQYPAEEL